MIRKYLARQTARVCCALVAAVAGLAAFTIQPAFAATLEEQLVAESPQDLAQAARELGDAKRGAILFYQPYMACTKCHVNGRPATLGPDLTKSEEPRSDLHLIESVLTPSRVIRKGFDSVTVVTTDGKQLVGVVTKDADKHLMLREATGNTRQITLPRDTIDEVLKNTQSIMPAGQVNQLASRQQFLDLTRYLMEISEHGLQRARELEPPPSAYAARPLPEYEKEIDHAGMIRDLNGDSLKRGAAIYNRLCINCHGTHDRPGSLPTSLRFATGKFKNGADPYTMYRTLTRGFGMMVPQMWMVPQQKYDVIHYIREAYLKEHNPTQYFAFNKDYLANLPKGTTRGPAPSNIVPWEQMDYGHNLVATYEIGSDGTNFAYKGNAIRLDPGPGGVSQGRYWMIFDYDTLRMAAAWTGKGFIDWHGINFNGGHNIHPRIVGDLQLVNPTGPGWANPDDGSWKDPRFLGRDDRAYGPLPRDWAHYKGMYYHGQQVVIEYTVGQTDVLEMPRVQLSGETPVFTRTFDMGSRDKELTLVVARHGADPADLVLEPLAGSTHALVLRTRVDHDDKQTTEAKQLTFDGSTRVELAKPDGLRMQNQDYSIAARIKTTKGGAIFTKTARQAEWVPDGKTFFVRGGRLCFDVGWVGVVQSQKPVADSKWHDVAMTFDHESSVVQLFVDGRRDNQKQLKAKLKVKDHVARIGYGASNFPGPQTFFGGEIEDVRFYDRVLAPEEVRDLREVDDGLVGRWAFKDSAMTSVADLSGEGHSGTAVIGPNTASHRADGPLVAGISGDAGEVRWKTSDAGDLLLTIPVGNEAARFTLWMARADDRESISQIVGAFGGEGPAELASLTQGGPARFPQTLTTAPIIGRDDGPFAVDVITHPVENPWFCRARLTGFDFFSDGDRAAVCAWDGSVWLVTGLSSLTPGGSLSQPPELTWRRIASGLFQPLGLKIIDGKMYVTCRDQICILHDLNGDGEIDYFENFNNDHQVTDHFHEFAMGLQTDADGNFYYAKSARHALTALVPHHGTLLRVSRDGSRTDIVAAGFRAANGVCLNPDGTFIVTDQEGHWNPKNRINWVSEGGFYGNMFGYHNVTDSSDEAMEQPLCWVTNAFDRSPAELLWADSPGWGPLEGTLLNLSYGYGKVYVVPHERINGQAQGGMCQLPIPQFPTGVMRGRFHPKDHQLYACGMFAWAGNQQQPGGFYRIRYTGQPVHLPVGLQARSKGMELRFSGTLDAATAKDVDRYSVKVWSLKRTADYGSKHYDERFLKVAAATLASDGRTLLLEIPEIAPTWCMEIKYSLASSDGAPFEGVIHNTIHALGD
ncbi:MAG: heme-binding protein [Planctomycetaceae bacterium]|nr:heme-binding protein [Planctomycetaceae bacterium]